DVVVDAGIALRSADVPLSLEGAQLDTRSTGDTSAALRQSGGVLIANSVVATSALDGFVLDGLDDIDVQAGSGTTAGRGIAATGGASIVVADAIITGVSAGVFTDSAATLERTTIDVNGAASGASGVFASNVVVRDCEISVAGADAAGGIYANGELSDD